MQNTRFNKAKTGKFFITLVLLRLEIPKHEEIIPAAHLLFMGCTDYNYSGTKPLC